MDIVVAMLVADKERQKKYKRIIQYYMNQELVTPNFKIYTTLKNVYEDFVLNGERADIILLQASKANFEVMKKVRELDRNCIILYPAQNTEDVLLAFESMPMAYVVPQEMRNENSMASAIVKALRYIKVARKQLEFETKSKVLSYALYEIDYFESQYRLVHIVKRNGSVETITKKLDDIERENQLENFYRCHQSYLVNMDHVKSIDKATKTVYLDSGRSVPSSKQLFSGFLEAFRKYKGGAV